MLKMFPNMLLSSAQKVTHCAQRYAHHYCNHVTVYIATVLLFLMTALA